MIAQCLTVSDLTEGSKNIAWWRWCEDRRHRAQHRAEASTPYVLLLSILHICHNAVFPLLFPLLAPRLQDTDAPTRFPPPCFSLKGWQMVFWPLNQCRLPPPALSCPPHTYLIITIEKQALVRILVTKAKNEKRNHLQTSRTTTAQGRGRSDECPLCHVCVLFAEQSWK